MSALDISTESLPAYYQVTLVTGHTLGPRIDYERVAPTIR